MIVLQRTAPEDRTGVGRQPVPALRNDNATRAVAGACVQRLGHFDLCGGQIADAETLGPARLRRCTDRPAGNGEQNC